MLDKLVLATRNAGKIREIEQILTLPGLRILSMNDAKIEGEAIEDGSSFLENARKKARYAVEKSGLPSAADDSGLEVFALGGRPGIYSARYAGENATDAQRIEKLLDELSGEPDRRAQFVCAVSLVFPDGKELAFEGTCKGEILDHVQEVGGFGYDPVFYLPKYGKTFAQMELEVKNQISHRSKAFLALKAWLAGQASD